MVAKTSAEGGGSPSPRRSHDSIIASCTRSCASASHWAWHLANKRNFGACSSSHPCQSESAASSLSEPLFTRFPTVSVATGTFCLSFLVLWTETPAFILIQSAQNQQGQLE